MEGLPPHLEERGRGCHDHDRDGDHDRAGADGAAAEAGVATVGAHDDAHDDQGHPGDEVGDEATALQPREVEQVHREGAERRHDAGE